MAKHISFDATALLVVMPFIQKRHDGLVLYLGFGSSSLDDALVHNLYDTLKNV